MLPVYIIKIYPEWNVNKEQIEEAIIEMLIKIYPEWNVNFDKRSAWIDLIN